MLGSFKYNILSMSLFSKFKVQISVFYNDFKLTYCYDGLCKKPNRRTAKKVWWQIGKKEERGWKSFLFFSSLLDPRWWLSVICLCLQIIFWIVILRIQITTLPCFVCMGQVGTLDGKMLESGAKWARGMFVNRNDQKPWWQTASWWRQGQSGCQRSSQPLHCGKGEAASASPAETLIFSFSLLYITFSCVRWDMM